jgi:hypothetical protein
LAVSITIGTPDSARMIRQTSMPGQLGQHQVEQDRGPVARPELVERCAAVGGLRRPEAFGLEGIGEGLAQGRLVLDDQDRRAIAANPIGPC